MNKHEAYNACHEIMLTNPHHTAYESNGVTYLMAQIADRDGDIVIQIHPIHPDMPSEGNLTKFTEMSEDMQVALLALPHIGELMGRAHQQLARIRKLSEDPSTHDEARELLHHSLRKLRAPTP